MDPIERKNRIQCILQDFRFDLKDHIREDYPIDVQIIQDAIHEELFQNDLTVKKVREKGGIGDRSYTTRFRDVVGQTMGQYIRKKRLQAAKNLLNQEENISITTVAGSVGYRYRTFVRQFVREYGCTPSECRLGGHNHQEK